MSVQALGWVLDHSEARLGDRLVLIALANHGHDDGSGAYLSQAGIAAEARLDARQVRRCLTRLEDAGRIVRTGVTDHTTPGCAPGVVVWRIVMGGADLSDGQIVRGQIRRSPRTNRAKPLSDLSAKPSVNRLNRGTSPDYDSLVIE